MEQAEILLKEDFDEESKNKDNKKKKLIRISLILVSIIAVISIIVIIILLTLPKDEEKNGGDSPDDDKNTPFKILLNDSKIHKPSSSNLISEIIQLKNGLQAILISEKNTTVSSIDIETSYGSCLDIIPGFAHFSEHMAFRGGKKFRENSYMTGLNYIGASNDAFTTMESTNYYFYTKTGVEYETFIDILADSLSNPTLNPEIYKTEINNLNSEFLMSNTSDDYILNNILYSLTNKNHPLHNAFSIGNNVSLNSISTNEMEKRLKAYFQQAYNPENLIVLLRSNKSLEELENLTLKYFNYDIIVNETMGNKERDEIRKKIKEERLFKKENGAKILKYYSKIAHNLNTSDYYNLLIFSFGINNMVYTNGFNSIDFLNFLINKVPNSSIHEYLLSKDYIYLLRSRIYIQFFERETGFIHIYVFLTKTGLSHIEEIIKIVFHYLNLIKNSVNELEKDIFPNYQKYKLNKFNYYYNENEDYNALNRQTIINMRKHGMENIFKDDVPENFDKNLFAKFMEDNINIENAIISLNSNYNITQIELFNNYSTKYLDYYGNEFNITDLNPDLVDTLKKFPVDESLLNIIKLRNINEYFTNISKPTEPCYYESNEKCIEKHEYNPLIDLNYKKERCDDNETYICYFANDRSLNIPKVKILLKLKTKVDDILTPNNKVYFTSLYFNTILPEFFLDFLEDDNNAISTSYKPGTEEFSIIIDTYKDVSKIFFEKFIDRIMTLYEEEEYNRVIRFSIFNIYLRKGGSTLDLEGINIGAIFDMIECGYTDKYPFSADNDLRILEMFNYANVKYFFNLFINSFIENSKLYLIGDLDENLISDLSKIVRDRIPINVNNNLNDNIKDIEEKLNIFNEELFEFNFESHKNEYKSFNFVHYNENRYINNIKKNKLFDSGAQIFSKEFIQIPNNVAVNYIYSNDNKYENHSFAGLFYTIDLKKLPNIDILNIFLSSIAEKIITDLRTKKGLGYHCLVKFQTSINQTNYFVFYVQGAMKTPIQVQYDIEEVLMDILYIWEPDNFNSIVKNYIDYFTILRNSNTFSKRVEAFISGNNLKENKKYDIYVDLTDTSFRDIANIMKAYFVNPSRIGIFEYANYIEKDFIAKEFEEKNGEDYLLNKNISVNYTYDINYFRKNGY